MQSTNLMARNDSLPINADSTADTILGVIPDSGMVTHDSIHTGIDLKTGFIDRFQHFNEKGNGGKPLDYQPLVPDWIFGTLFICLIFITWIKYWNYKILKMFVKALATRRDFQILLRESTNIPISVPFSINLVYTFSLALSTYIFFKDYFRQQFYPDINDLIFFSICFIAVFSLFILKNFFTAMIGKVFKINQIFNEYHYNNLIYRMLASVGLVLLLVIVFFSGRGSLEYVVLIYFSAIYLIRSTKGVFIIMTKQNTSIYYIILYFCTLEILPMVVLAKLVIIYT